jgi:signal transduction histidine kinase
VVARTPADVHDLLGRAAAELDAALRLPGSVVEQARRVAEAQALLATCAQRLTGEPGTKAKDPAQQGRPDRAARLAALADLGELAGPLAHEFNNFLNVLLLHVAILEQEVPESLRASLEEINRQGKDIAEIIRLWQQYRRSRQFDPGPVDLNRAVRAAVTGLAQRADVGAVPIAVQDADGADSEAAPPASDGVTVQLHLAADPLPVAAAEEDLERLCAFLVANAVTATSTGSVLVHTARDGAGVLLRIDDSGPVIPTELLAEVFDLDAEVREGTNRLELAACKSIVRRVQGRLRAENRAEGGVSVAVQLSAVGAPVASERGGPSGS